MALRVIGAGLGRTGTLSLKLALEHIGLGPCYHMSEMLSRMRRDLPLWIESAKGHPQWDAIFAGYPSSTDYPGCMFWRELMAKYPDAKVILTTRDPGKWFESVSETVFSEGHRARLEGNPMMAEFFRLTVFGDLGDRLGDRARMVEYFNAWNQAVIDEVPADKLLVYAAGDGWEPLCAFLGVPVPPEPYPRVNSREEMSENTGRINRGEMGKDGPPPPEFMEQMVQQYLTELKAKAFPPAP
ncbi:MAG: sulfotransferase family protein [Croceibacterium sp.]